MIRPGEYHRFANMRVRDLLYQAGGPSIEASMTGEIARTEVNGQVSILPIQLDAAMTSSDAGIVLEDQDVFIMRPLVHKRQWPVVVTLTGEVERPGQYAVAVEKETLKSLIQRAGGLTGEAYVKGTLFMRLQSQVVPNENYQLASDVFQVLQQVARNITMANMARYGALPKAAQQPQTSDVSTLLNSTIVGVEGQAGLPPRLIQRILSTGRIPIDLDRVLAGGTGDPGLREGDVIHIPRRNPTIVIAGAVSMPSALPFRQDWNIKAYVDRAGGFTKDADARQVLILRVNGELIRSGEGTVLESGDLVLVPPKAIIAMPSAWERFLEVLRVVVNGAVLYKVLK